MPVRLSILTAAAIALTAAPLPSALAQEAEPDPVIEFQTSDAKMNAAKAEAQETLPEWLAVLADPQAGASDISFKFPLDGWEHIWVGNVSLDDGRLQGTLNNSPHSEGWALGDPVSVPLELVSDWGYRGADGVMRGHRTTRVILEQLPPETVAAIKADFGW